MKKLFAILLISGVAFSASAQHLKNSHRLVRSHISIGVGSHLNYGSGYGHNRYYSPFNTFPSRSYNNNRPTNLDLQIQDLENEYRDRKWSAKHDKTLSRQQRKTIIQDLKFQNEKAIIDARRGYYKKSY